MQGYPNQRSLMATLGYIILWPNNMLDNGVSIIGKHVMVNNGLSRFLPWEIQPLLNRHQLYQLNSLRLTQNMACLWTCISVEKESFRAWSSNPCPRRPNEATRIRPPFFPMELRYLLQHFELHPHRSRRPAKENKAEPCIAPTIPRTTYLDVYPQ